MILSRIIVLCIIAINTISENNLFGQNDTSILLADFVRYNELILQEKFQESFNYAHDSLFNFIPKSVLLESFIKSRSNKNVITKTNLPTEFKISPIIIKNSTKYSIIEYRSRLELNILAISLEPDSILKLEKINRQLENYRLIFGNESVTFDSKNQNFVINGFKKCVATLFKDAKNWKFILIDNHKRLILAKKFIPEIVFN